MWSSVLKSTFFIALSVFLMNIETKDVWATGDKGNCLREDSPPNICGDCGIPDEESLGCDGVCHSGTEFDECKVCGGTGPGECGCDLTITKDPCGVCDGPGINEYGCCEAQVNCGYGCQDGPCPGSTRGGKECLWVAASGGYSGLMDNDWQKPNSLVQTSVNQTYTNSATVPGCFREMFQQECSLGKDLGAVLIYGNCNGSHGGGKIGKGAGLKSYHFAQWLKAPATFVDYVHYSMNENQVVTFLMDKNCHYSEWDASKDICGFAGAVQSPISLIWDEGTSLDAETSVVDFSLDVTRPNALSLWKGSGDAPLLVYDPQRTGDVRTASQLFGTYTFHGMQKVRMQQDQVSGKWSHGFEALGHLDVDNDNRVSGNELQGLYLWFDGNRNARVDSKELRSVQELGLVSLFYKNPVIKEDSQDLELAIGYEREVDGVILNGKSVDWFGEVFETKQEALQALYGLNAASTGMSPGETVDSNVAVSDVKRSETTVEVSHPKNVSGLWMWHMKEQGAEQQPGLFVFTQHENDEVSGYSVAETVLEENTSYHSMVSMHPVKGSTSNVASTNSRTLRFQIADRKSGVTAMSKAKLSEDGMTLRGSTTQVFLNQDTEQSKRIEYTWIAYKVQ